MQDPLHQFKILTLVPIKLFGLDFSISNSVVFIFISILIICCFLHITTRNLSLLPSRSQVLVEKIFTSTTDVIKEYLGHKAYLPFFFTLFFFILTCNLVGFVPNAFTVTSQFIITFALAFCVILFSIGVGLKKHGLKLLTLFVPSGLPLSIKFLVIPIEVASFAFRPLSLGIRLFANMVAGHVIIKVFAYFCQILGAIALPFALAPLVINVILFGFELMGACLQAYVFLIMSCIYVKDTLHLHS